MIIKLIQITLTSFGILFISLIISIWLYTLVYIIICIIIGIKDNSETSSVEVSDNSNILEIPNPKNREIGKLKNKNDKRVEFIFLILITSFYISP